MNTELDKHRTTEIIAIPTEDRDAIMSAWLRGMCLPESLLKGHAISVADASEKDARVYVNAWGKPS